MGDIVGRDGAPMMLVPDGEALLGSDESDPLAHETELPRRSLRLEAFYMDRYEVTVAQYEVFLDSIRSEGHARCHPGEPANRDHAAETGSHVRWSSREHPVVGVGWYDAYAYCAWAGERLPDEKEWEKAARGTDGRIYPWGDDPPSARQYGNFRDAGSFDTRAHGMGVRRSKPTKGSYVEDYSDGQSGAAPVGSYPLGMSPYGVEDLSGNAYEWVRDRFGDRSKGVAPEAGAEPESSGWAAVRGGSFLSEPRMLRAAARSRSSVWERREDLGFRCAADPPHGDSEQPQR